MISGLEHIGIAVSNLDEALILWQRAAGAVVEHTEIVASQGVKAAVLRVGALRIELLQPIDDNSPVAKFIAGRGDGIHHLALVCDSAQEELDRAKSDGVRLVEGTARLGIEGSHVGFLHPRALGGVLVEFVDHTGSNS